MFDYGTNQIKIPADILPGNYTISIEMKDKNDLSREISSHTIKVEVKAKVIKEEVEENQEEEEDTENVSEEVLN